MTDHQFSLVAPAELATAVTPEELWVLVSGALDRMNVHRNLKPLLRERFLAGAAEHGDDWRHWALTVFVRNVIEERMDDLLYTAMGMVAHGDQAADVIRGELADFMAGDA